MKALLALLFITTNVLAETWPLDAAARSLQIHGTAKPAAGAVDQSLALDGNSVIEQKDTADLNGSFTVSVWFNPYVLEGSQQMIVGKNRYSLN